MRKYEVQILFLDRLELRSGGTALERLNALGSAGWRIVHIQDDSTRASDLAVFMEREIL